MCFLNHLFFDFRYIKIVFQGLFKILIFSALSSELQKLLDEAYALLKEKDNEKDSIGKSMSDELAKVRAESEKALNEAKSKMVIAKTEFETQSSVLTAKLQLAESKLETEKQNLERLNKENSQIIIDLNTRLTQLQATVDDKTLELNKGKFKIYNQKYFENTVSHFIYLFQS